MDVQLFYFANVRLELPSVEVPEKWVEFIDELPYSAELAVSVTREEISIDRSNALSIGNINVISLETGWLFLPNAFWERGSSSANRPVMGKLYVSKDYKKAICYCSVYDKSILSHLRTVMDAVLPRNGGSIIHASCVTHKGKSVLFCGSSQTGKSTHAKLWEKRYQADMLSSDAPAVLLENNHAVAYGMPWDGSDQIITQTSAPVGAIIELRQAKRNSIRRLSSSQSFRMLMKQGHIPVWDEEGMFMAMGVLKKLSKDVACYRLNCLPNVEAAELLHKYLFENNTELLMEEESEMRVKDGYVLKYVIDEYIVVPTGANMKVFEGALVLSETAAFAWEKMQKNITQKELIDAIIDEFEIDYETVSADVSRLIEKLNSYGVLEELL